MIPTTRQTMEAQGYDPCANDSPHCGGAGVTPAPTIATTTEAPG